MRTLSPWLVLGLCVTASACGPAIPRRFVLERDVENWSYRRYQHVLDVEFAVEGSPGVGHTATYVRRARRGDDTIPYANVFVAAHENATGMTDEVRRQIRALSSYEISVRAFGGGHVWHLDGGPGDRWVVWVSGSHVVKVGASAEVDEVPEDMVGAYMEIYPSDLDEHGRARPGTLSAGELPTRSGSEEGEEDDTPHFLRENAPR